jgi:hypothetical protein
MAQKGSAMSALTRQDVLARLGAAGGFYRRERRGLRPSLWKLTAKGAGPVTAEWLENYLDDVPRELVVEVLLSNLKGLPPLTNDMLELIGGAS